MVRAHCEGDRGDRLVAFGCLGLCEYIGTVIQAFAFEDVSVCTQCDFRQRAVSQLLLKLELCACQRLAVLVDLAQVELVGEGDDIVPGSLLETIRVIRVVAGCCNAYALR